MKNFLLSLSVLALVVSCGSGSGNNVGTPGTGTTSSSAITVNDPSAVALGSLIDNYSTSFGTGMATYYENWTQLVAHAPNVTYEYGVPTTTSVSWSICFITCSGSAVPAVSRSVIHSTVDVLTKQNELKAIINKKSPFYGISMSNNVYTIVTSDNEVYKFDLKMPLQANPVYSQKSSGKEQLQTIR